MTQTEVYVTFLSRSGQRSRQRTKYFATIARAEQFFARALRMRHQSQNVTSTIANASDAVAGTIGVSFLRNSSLGIAVPKNDAVLLLQLSQSLIVTDVISFGMSNRQTQNASR